MRLMLPYLWHARLCVCAVAEDLAVASITSSSRSPCTTVRDPDESDPLLKKSIPLSVPIMMQPLTPRSPIDIYNWYSPSKKGHEPDCFSLSVKCSIMLSLSRVLSRSPQLTPFWVADLCSTVKLKRYRLKNGATNIRLTIDHIWIQPTLEP
jgi:hypothetical protein